MNAASNQGQPKSSRTLNRLFYPKEAVMLRSGDTLVYKTRKGERLISPYKWSLNKHTPVGEDAEIWERKPYGGLCLLSRDNVLAVLRESD